MNLHSRPARTAARRAARAVAALGAATLLLTACGTDSDSGKSSGDKAGKADSASSTTRTVKDATGKAVEIPAEPKRIVTLTQEDLDAVLALDINTAPARQELTNRTLDSPALMSTASPWVT
ncbi:hypothetical protein ACWDMY_35190, partial [Streptomyces globisporus]